MRILRSKALVAVLALLMMTGLLSFVASSPVNAAATGGCYGASCNNLDPEGRCSGDAKTVGAMDVGDGMLQLRWSPSCAANWGRFTAYSRTELGYQKAHIAIHARVTVWNPNATSYQTAHHSKMIGTSTWSFMTDGTKMACTGVELTHTHQSETGSGAIDEIEPLGWTWGPCY
jgi:hypothetical protein